MERTFSLPAGVRDWLPGEAARKRRLEDGLAGLFQSWGYREVVTPTLEFYETMRAAGGAKEEQLLKLLDRQGQIQALRPDLTTPIARLAATRLAGEALPLRFFYLQNVFRWEEPQAGRQREFYQAGVELLGAPGPEADLEVIALALEALERAGLADFRLGIGHVKVIRRALEGLKVPPGEVAAAKKAVGKKDLVGLEELLERCGVSPAERERVSALCLLHGGREELEGALRLAAGRAEEEALENLAAVWRGLERANLSGRAFLDLGVVRDLDYYTGVVFEGYAPGLGFPLCGGGRYDGLLAVFGLPCAATGFAVGLERLLLALNSAGGEEKAVQVLLAGPDFSLLLKEAARLRASGLKVETEVRGLSRVEATAYAAAKGIPEVRWLEGGGNGA